MLDFFTSDHAKMRASTMMQVKVRSGVPLTHIDEVRIDELDGMFACGKVADALRLLVGERDNEANSWSVRLHAGLLAASLSGDLTTAIESTRTIVAGVLCACAQTPISTLCIATGLSVLSTCLDGAQPALNSPNVKVYLEAGAPIVLWHVMQFWMPRRAADATLPAVRAFTTLVRELTANVADLRQKLQFTSLCSAALSRQLLWHGVELGSDALLDEAKTAARKAHCVTGLVAYVDDVANCAIARRVPAAVDDSFVWKKGSSLASTLGQQAKLLPPTACATPALVRKIKHRYEALVPDDDLALKCLLLWDWTCFLETAADQSAAERQTLNELKAEVRSLVEVLATLALDWIDVGELCPCFATFKARLLTMFADQNCTPSHWRSLCAPTGTLDKQEQVNWSW
jgi:hypothetical protein